LLTSIFCYVFIESMHAQLNKQAEITDRTPSGLSLRALNLVLPAALLELLILSIGAGSG